MTKEGDKLSKRKKGEVSKNRVTRRLRARLTRRNRSPTEKRANTSGTKVTTSGEIPVAKRSKKKTNANEGGKYISRTINSATKRFSKMGRVESE